MKRKYNLKRCAALVMSGALTLGAIPLPGLVQEAQAASYPAAEPSAVAYATKDQLKAEMPPLVTGYTDYDGDVSLVGRLKLGRNSDDKVMEWYILGSDTGVGDGDNVAVFATSNMVEATDEHKYDGTTGQQFDPYLDDTTKKWSGDDGGKYDASTVTSTMVAGETEVYRNHYGMSLLRKDTAELVTSKFTAEEQKLLQATEVTTQDYKNGSPALYTTTDILYAAWGDPTGSDKSNIYIGSGKDTAGKKITISYDFYGPDFWLRSPYPTQAKIALLVDSDYWMKLSESYIQYDDSVRPATNFKLSDVAFASAASATTTSGKAAAIRTADSGSKYKTAMMLRFDGKDQKIGTANVDTSTGTITATKGDTSEDVTLIVQGKNGSTDWYYTKTISGTETVTATTIATELGFDLDLSLCKVWLETPVEPSVDKDKQTLFYAVEAETSTHTHTFTDWAVDKNDESKHTRSCTCGYTETEVHDFPEHKASDATYHWRECSKCGYEENKEEHTFKEDGKCDDVACNYDGKHAFYEVGQTEPTCTEDGYKEHYECSVSGHEDEIFTATLGLYVLTDKASIVNKDKLGHQAGSEYSKVDDTYCAPVCVRVNAGVVCGATITDEKAKHDFKNGICTRCGYVKSSGGNSGSSSSDGSTRNSERGTSGSSSGGSGGGGGTGSAAGIIGTSGTSGAWVKDNTGWRYKYTSGTYATGTNTNDADGKAIEKITWIKINNADYAFGSDAYLKTGWVLDNTDGKWYYCDVNKGRLYGWYYDTEDNYWYYLDANTGAMLTGWQLIGGKQYYFAPAPSVATYTFDASSAKWVYSNATNYRPYGSMYAGTTTPDNHQVDADGARIS